MIASDEMTIETSKARILMLTLVACAFVAIGLWVLSFDTISGRRGTDVTLVYHGLAVVVIVICGLVGALGIRKIIENKPGLIFSNVGMLVGSDGLIPWGDVTGIGVYETSVGNIYRLKMLVVKVANPDKYIEVGSAPMRKLKRKNHNIAGGPFTISSTGLKISFSDLQRIAGEYFLRYGKRA